MPPTRYEHLLFPGRHHLMTRFQVDRLVSLASHDALPAVDADGAEIDVAGAQVHVAITSWDHGSTRRNPVPGHRREAIAERVAAATLLDLRVWPIADVPATPRFAEYLLESIGVAGGPDLVPDSCIVACSTPAVSALFRDLGFRIASVEDGAAPGGGDVPRPWDVLERIVEARSLASALDVHPASLEVWRRYDLLGRVMRAHADPLLTDEGNITDTRDYATYAAAFDSGAPRKWAQLREFVVPGRIVDIGCGAGALLAEAAADPTLAESDLYGIEATRSLFDECVHRKAAGAFANPNTFFYQRNIMAERLFEDGSVDTTLSTALTHELWSYLDEDSLRSFIRRIHDHTAPGGVWLNLDVAGPLDGDRLIWIEPLEGVSATGVSGHDGGPVLDRDRGGAPVARTLSSTEEAEALLPRLSMLEGFVQFASDWHGRASWRLVEGGNGSSGPWIETSLRTAMDWLAKKDYPDNWLSEMHEEFCYWDERDWRAAVEHAGFELAPGSGGFTNQWLVDNRFATSVRLHEAGRPGSNVPWPHTHVLLVCRRPGPARG